MLTARNLENTYRQTKIKKNQSLCFIHVQRTLIFWYTDFQSLSNAITVVTDFSMGCIYYVPNTVLSTFRE